MTKTQKQLDEESFTAYWQDTGRKKATVHRATDHLHSVAIAAWMAAKSHERVSVTTRTKRTTQFAVGAELMAAGTGTTQRSKRAPARAKP